MKVFDKSAKVIKVTEKEQFCIELQPQSNTGNLWSCEPKAPIKLVKEEFRTVPPSYKEARPQQFVFAPEAKGKTEIHFVHKRPWETRVLEKITYTVEVQ